VKRKGGGRGLLQIEATYKAEIINIAEYLSMKHAEGQFVNIVKSHDSNQPNMNSTIIDKHQHMHFFTFKIVLV